MSEVPLYKVMGLHYLGRGDFERIDPEVVELRDSCLRGVLRFIIIIINVLFITLTCHFLPGMV